MIHNRKTLYKTLYFLHSDLEKKGYIPRDSTVGLKSLGSTHRNDVLHTNSHIDQSFPPAESKMRETHLTLIGGFQRSFPGVACFTFAPTALFSSVHCRGSEAVLLVCRTAASKKRKKTTRKNKSMPD